MDNFLFKNSYLQVFLHNYEHFNVIELTDLYIPSDSFKHPILGNVFQYSLLRPTF
jgi:hypothetical protein